LVEACRLDSDAGTAVVLLNWSDDPIEQLELLLTLDSEPATVTTARGAPLTAHWEPGRLRVRLPLAHVDVLLVEQ
jgi:hypothetical protein